MTASFEKRKNRDSSANFFATKPSGGADTMPSPLLHPFNVRYLEVDQQGVVFNMWYLAYFDDAMTAFLHANGLPYGDMMAAGYDVQLVHAEIDWKGGLRWGDDAAIAVRLLQVGNTS